MFYYFGNGFVGRIVCLGSGDREQTYPGLWFLPVWHKGIKDSVLLLVVLLVPLGAAAHCFLCFCVCCRVVSLFSLRFVHLFFSYLFPCTSKVRWVLAVWGAALLGEGYSRCSSARDVAEDLLCFLFFLFLRLAIGSSGGLSNGSGRCLLELLLYESQGFLV